MVTRLQEYFPIIHTREEVLEEIRTKEKLNEVFSRWSEAHREEFLNSITGVKGVKILYDSFFKEIFNPETVPERLEDFLSLLLGRKIEILEVLPNDSTRMADETSLLITDIVVKLEDGGLANLEVQKIGYAFPGERSACYSADLLLRQYKRVRSKRKKYFSYRDIKEVYTIVLYEKSMREFQAFPDCYIHHFEQTSNTGLHINLLQKYCFIPLDIFQKVIQNRGIETKLDAWLGFLSIDEPEYMIELMERYPEFKSMYQHIYEMCRNVEGVMDMFSKELQELDRNTVRYMIDEMQEDIDRQKQILEEKDNLIAEKDNAIAEKDNIIAEKERLYQEALRRIDELENR